MGPRGLRGASIPCRLCSKTPSCEIVEIAGGFHTGSSTSRADCGGVGDGLVRRWHVYRLLNVVCLITCAGWWAMVTCASSPGRGARARRTGPGGRLSSVHRRGLRPGKTALFLWQTPDPALVGTCPPSRFVRWQISGPPGLATAMAPAATRPPGQTIHAAHDPIFTAEQVLQGRGGGNPPSPTAVFSV